uniref:Uncharacterized protein n=1 Tax=Noctiluca scintillans TaxID=2966 RepID=A0A7S1FH88_NOCSC|mmetsp:Transcript_61360/g.163137  ORF Transcript_61360/g.163137 Transcript_61360/m.163137 type:complete len:618 (+) Transcript_61360:61-1914(+)
MLVPRGTLGENAAFLRRTYGGTTEDVSELDQPGQSQSNRTDFKKGLERLGHVGDPGAVVNCIDLSREGVISRESFASALMSPDDDASSQNSRRSWTSATSALETAPGAKVRETCASFSQSEADLCRRAPDEGTDNDRVDDDKALVGTRGLSDIMDVDALRKELVQERSQREEDVCALRAEIQILSLQLRKAGVPGSDTEDTQSLSTDSDTHMQASHRWTVTSIEQRLNCKLHEMSQEFWQRQQHQQQMYANGVAQNRAALDAVSGLWQAYRALEQKIESVTITDEFQGGFTSVANEPETRFPWNHALHGISHTPSAASSSSTASFDHSDIRSVVDGFQEELTECRALAAQAHTVAMKASENVVSLALSFEEQFSSTAARDRQDTQTQQVLARHGEVLVSVEARVNKEVKSRQSEIGQVDAARQADSVWLHSHLEALRRAVQDLRCDLDDRATSCKLSEPLDACAAASEPDPERVDDTHSGTASSGSEPSPVRSAEVCEPLEIRLSRKEHISRMVPQRESDSARQRSVSRETSNPISTGEGCRTPPRVPTRPPMVVCQPVLARTQSDRTPIRSSVVRVAEADRRGLASTLSSPKPLPRSLTAEIQPGRSPRFSPLQFH